MISIITPVYNIEKFLRQGLDSIVNQTFEDWELIIVDDGSPDGCPAICDEYAGKDDRIRVIHQENRGVVDARGAGIKEAKGDYILHFDADDTLEPYALEKVQAAINDTGCDMIVFLNRIMEEPDMIKHPEGLALGRKYDRDEIINAMFSFVAIWNKAVKTPIAQAANREYDGRISLEEDLLRVIPIVCRIKDAYLMEDCLYNYRMDGGGMHKLTTWKEIQDVTAVMENILSDLEDYSLLTAEREKLLFRNYLRSVHRIFRKLLGEHNIKRTQIRELRSHPVFKRAQPYAKKDIIGFKKAIWIRLIRLGLVRGAR